MSAAVAAWTAAYGLEILFVAVALESVGVPVPGESSLIAAGVLASRGDLQMSAVVAAAATAAIVGDNVGYVLGRWGGRRLLDRWGPLRRFGPRARYGGAAVFLGRFITGIRVAAAWMAGVSCMQWWRFLLWNALGAIVWATVVALSGDVVGQAARAALSHLR
jgi:membrane-associated protein